MAVAAITFSKIVSVAFAPQIGPAYFFTVLFYASHITNYVLLGIPIFFASVVPLLSLAVFTRLSGSRIFVREREKRYPLFYAAIVSFALGFIALKYADAPFILTALMLAYTLNSILAAILNKYSSKVSIHAWNISGPAVAVLYQFGIFYFFLVIALSLFVGLSRILMKEHTIEEVEIAVIASIALTYLVIFIMPVALPGLI